jgi:hypothetical protein
MIKEVCGIDFSVEKNARLRMSIVEDSKNSGLCKVFYGRKEIDISRHTLKYAPIYKDQVFYHEMTHCLLDKDHVSNPNNYMHESSFPNLSKEELLEQVKIDIKKGCLILRGMLD